MTRFAAALLHSVASFGNAVDLELLELMAAVAPTYAPGSAAQFAEILDIVRALPPGNQLKGAMRKKRRDKLGELFEGMRPLAETLHSNIREQLSDTAYQELELAMRAGVLSIDPLPGVDISRVGDQNDDDDIAMRYFARVQETLTSGNTYPLFDDATSNLVSLGVEAGVFTPVPAARHRGRDAALASGLFDQLPNFEHANMSEVLDIREELRGPLVRFRQGIREISKDIEAVPEDPGFASAIEDAWTSKVAPALLEIEDAIRENNSLGDLVRRIVHDPAGLLAATGVFGLGVAAGPMSGLPAAVPLLLTSAVATGAAGSLASARAYLAQRAAEKEATETQFYFLYGANSRMHVRT